MRTLVISDLHLGMRNQRDVLRRRAPLAVLLDALAQVERLVLLGDVVELSEHNPEDAPRPPNRSCVHSDGGWGRTGK